MNFVKSSLKIKRSLLGFFVTCLLYGTCFANPSITQEVRKTFIITGASGELGGATARLLALRDYLWSKIVWFLKEESLSNSIERIDILKLILNKIIYILSKNKLLLVIQFFII